MNRLETKQNVLGWALNKGLLSKEKLAILKQTLKMVSEVGELCDAIIKSDDLEVDDAIGDVQVCLTILCNQLGKNEDDCFEGAYNVIKNRTGKTVEGVFIKD